MLSSFSGLARHTPVPDFGTFLEGLNKGWEGNVFTGWADSLHH